MELSWLIRWAPVIIRVQANESERQESIPVTHERHPVALLV